jgi:chaperonin GroES
VLAVGPRRADITAGDRVLFRQWGGTEVVVGGKELLLLSPRDVFAVVSE